MAMSFSLGSRLEQNMSMQLTPSQKLSLEILQLNIQNLEQRIGDELEGNPLLEVKEKSLEEDPYTNNPEQQELAKSLKESFEDSTKPVDDEKKIHTEHLESIGEYFEPYLNESYQGSKNQNLDDEEDDMLVNLEARDKSFEEYVSEQIEYYNPPVKLLPYIHLIITHLDERGYLNQPLEELSLSEDAKFTDKKMLHEAHQFIIQQIDPAGLGAHNLQECLLIQTRRLGNEFKFEEKILQEHFDELLQNKLDLIAKANQCDVQRIVEVVEFYKTLNFRPAAPFMETSASVLRPDAFVKYEPPDAFYHKGRFLIQLSKRGIPELQVIPGAVYKKGKLSKEEKQYILDKTTSGKALLEAIRRRNETLFMVIQAICQHQIDFFEEGRTALKPLLMQDIAKDLDMSAATITRTVKDKAIQTDYGIFPLKYFFSMKQVKMGDGEVNDRDEILEAVKKVIDEENKKKPYSDAAISKILLERGVKIATRTISKYRDILDIPSSNKRKQF